MCIKLRRIATYHLTIIDSNINLYTRFNADAGDLLDNITGSVQVNQPLVDTHLKAILHRSKDGEGENIRYCGIMKGIM